MIFRLLLWVALGVVAWLMLRPGRRVAPPRGAASNGTAETMVDCAACGLHFPASEAIRDGARLYCCTAHRDQGPRRAD
jgi:uncharacterized protein